MGTRPFLAFAALAFCFLSTDGLAQIKPLPPPTRDAKAIVLAQRSANSGYQDEIGHWIMRLSDTQGKTSDLRSFEYRRLEGTKTQGAKLLVTVLKPADLAGVRLLSTENPGRASDQWIYLPSDQRVKRIVSSAQNGRFLGSEFSYEDMRPSDPNAYEYKYLMEDREGGLACFVIQAVPRSAASAYSKTVMWIRRDNLQNARIDFYGLQGRLLKKAVFRDYRTVASHWRPFEVIMENMKTGRQTRLALKQVKFGTGLRAADFTLSALQR